MKNWHVLYLYQQFISIKTVERNKIAYVCYCYLIISSINKLIFSDKTLLTPPLFSRAYELSRQIHIINAYCRETEQYRDELHDSLWDLLDELIDVHTRVAPQSLYASMYKLYVCVSGSVFGQLYYNRISTAGII